MDHSNYSGHDHQDQSVNPSITLRKGKTEIKIENAAAIIKKINEMYPTRAEYESYWYAPSWKTKQKRTEAEIEKQRRWTDSARNWFQNEMFNGTGSFEVIVNEQELPKSPGVPLEHNEEYIPAIDLPPQPEPRVVQSVNKNAYEIRLEILKESLHWVSSRDAVGSATPEDVINVAKKLYSFVEDRRR